MLARAEATSTLAEPVVAVSHHTNANPAMELPSSDTAWLAQTVKKRGLQSFDDAAVAMAGPLR